MKDRFTGRPAIVTGAGLGIGRAIALRLHEEGAHVLAVDKNPTCSRNYHRRTGCARWWPT